MLTGNVLVSTGVEPLSGQPALSIEGDSEANSVTIDIQSDRLIVRGLDGTTINGGTDPAVLEASGDVFGAALVAALGEGDDSLRMMGGSFTGNGHIFAAGGNDSVEILNTAFGDLTVSTGAGDDTVGVSFVNTGTSAVPGSLAVYTSTGNDVAQVADVTVTGDLKVYAGAGNDAVGVGNATVDGNTTVSGWYGADQLAVSGSTLNSDLTIGGRSDQAAPLENTLVDDVSLLDIDGNGIVEISTDGRLLMRSMGGFTGRALTDGVTGANATRTDADAIGEYLSYFTQLVDADASVTAIRDGLKLVRHASGIDAVSTSDTAANTVHVKGTTITGTTEIDVREGRDTISLEDAKFANDLMMRTGGGFDSLHLKSTEFDDDFDIDMGADDDFVLFTDAMLKDLGELNTGAGDDKVVLAGQTELTRDPRFYGGDGAADAFFAESTVQFGRPRRASNFESDTADSAAIQNFATTVTQQVQAATTHFTPQLGPDSFTVTTRGAESPTVNLLANDQGIGLQVEAGLVESTKGARVTLANDGQLIYDPSTGGDLVSAKWGETVTDTFDYTVRDGLGNDHTATVTVSYVAPRSYNYFHTTDEDSVLNVAVADGVLQENRDANDTPLPSITAFDSSSLKGAVVSVNADGSFTYDPTTVTELQDLLPGQQLLDEFSYTLDGTHVGTVTISVDGRIDAPDELYQWQLVDDETQNMLTISAAEGVLKNDGGSGLTVTNSPTLTANGAEIMVSADGSFTYKLSGNFWATVRQAAAGELADYDSFQYTTSDQNTHTAVIQLTGRNDAPQANFDEFEIPSNAVFNSTISLMENDTDPDLGDTFETVPDSQQTTFFNDVTINADGTFSYDPVNVALSRGEKLIDYFFYTIRDASGKTSEAEVMITIVGSDHPTTTQPDTFSVGENEELIVDAIPKVKGLLANDEDIDTTDTLEVVDYTTTSMLGASVAVNKDGSFIYLPETSATLNDLKLGDEVQDKFTYQVSAGSHALPLTETVTVNVRGKLDPGEDDYTLGADGGDITQQPVLSIPAVIGLLANDELVAATAADGQRTTTYGATVNVNADGSFTYDPSTLDKQKVDDAVLNSQIPDTAFDQFTYSATGSNGLTVSHVATIRLDLDAKTPTYATGTTGITAQIVNRELVIDTTVTPTATQALHVSIAGGGSRLFVTSQLRDSFGGDSALDETESFLNTLYPTIGPFFTTDFDRVIYNGTSERDSFRVDARDTLGPIPVIINGNAGNDWLSGGNGPDVIRGGDGQDIIRGLAGNDELFGEGDADTISGELGDDLLNGGQEGEKDFLVGGAGSNILDMELVDVNLDGNQVNPSGFLLAPTPPSNRSQLAPVHASASGNAVLFEDQLPAGHFGHGTHIVTTGHKNSGNASLELRGSGNSKTWGNTQGHSARGWQLNPNIPIHSDSKISFQLWITNTQEDFGPTKEIMLSLNSTRLGWGHRAYWGNDIIGYSAQHKVRIGDLPRQGTWHTVTIDASAIGLQAGDHLREIEIGIVGARAFFDKIEVTSASASGGQSGGSSGANTGAALVVYEFDSTTSLEVNRYNSRVDSGTKTSGSAAIRFTPTTTRSGAENITTVGLRQDAVAEMKRVTLVNDSVIELDVYPVTSGNFEILVVGRAGADFSIAYWGNRVTSYSFRAERMGESLPTGRWTRVRVPLKSIYSSSQFVGKNPFEIKMYHGNHEFLLDRLSYSGVVAGGTGTGNHAPPSRVSGGSNAVAAFQLKDKPTAADLNKSGELTAYRNSDGSKVTLAGPSGIGFTFSGNRNAFSVENGNAEHFVARELVFLNTAVGSIPLPASSSVPLRIKTTWDSHSNRGKFDAIDIAMFELSSDANADKLFEFLNKDMGISIGGFNRSWGIKLGKDLGGLGLPLANAVPYIYFHGNGGANLMKFGGNSINADANKAISIAFDPSDPAFLVKLGGIPGPVSDLAFGVSKKGHIPFIANKEVWTDINGNRKSKKDPYFYGNIYAEGKLNIQKFQLSIEGLLVVDLDKDNDGNALGLQGNELYRMMYGQMDFEDAIANAIRDVQIGLNGKLNMEIGLGSSGTGVTIPIGEATAWWNGNDFSISAGSVNPFSGTFLEKVLQGGAQYEGDFYIRDNADFRGRVKARQSQAIGDLEMGSFEVELRKDGTKVGAQIKGSITALPMLNARAHFSGAVISNGAYSFSAGLSIGHKIGPVNLSGRISVFLTNDTSGNFGSYPKAENTLMGFEGELTGSFAGFGVKFWGKLHLMLHSSRFHHSSAHFKFWVGSTSGRHDVEARLRRGSDGKWRATLDLPWPVPDVNITF